MIIALSACSLAEPEVEEPGFTATKTFSQGDKEIAKVLSIGSSNLEVAAGPYQKALLCELAVQTITNQLSSGEALAGEQRTALKQVQAIYSQRVSASGEDEAQINRDRREIELAYPDVKQRARLAIGCLRELT
ncbi:hypothetical protein G7A66_10030 [Altererythrobacter sp. SALINAS58]|uniref:hypothetical protein n=1 Tax=Alteripontixanthobacter muriae TaxID=2705546 RepID=UPI0015773EDB|nr:hypothetical protein [Alteripontixanthobacter muriae]NTZ43412.1 hypothetical protein [Alteripontixanthobacter muriae]